MLSGKAKEPLASAVVEKVCGASGRVILVGTVRLPLETLEPFAAGGLPGVTVMDKPSPARKPWPRKTNCSPGPTVPSETAALAGGAGYVAATAGTAPISAMEP